MKSLDDLLNDITYETKQDVIIGIITQAIRDYRDLEEDSEIQRDAERFLFEDTEDLESYCQAADVNYEFVKAALDYIRK